MKLFQIVVLIFLVLFQDSKGLDPILLDKDHFYMECLESLNHLSLTNNYNELLTNGENNLKVISTHPSLERAIIEFAEAILNRPISFEEVFHLNGEPGNGLSGNPIFKVGSPLESCLVIKAFKGGSGEFSKEFLTLHTYNQSKLSDLHFPEIQGIGFSLIGNERYFLIGMQCVEGITVNDLFIKIFHQEEDSEERNRLINLLQKVYTKMGRGLAQFHYQRREINRPIPTIHLQALEKLLNSSHVTLTVRPETMYLAKQIQTITQSDKWLQIISQQFDLGYMHTDVHPGNFIVNLESEDLYLIDTGTETIGPRGVPIGLPFLDIAQIYNQLVLRTIWGLSNEEIDLLYSSFIQGYKSETSCFPTSEQMAFFQIIDMLNFFEWKFQVEDKLDEKSKTIIGEIYQYRVGKCLSILNDFMNRSATQLNSRLL